MGPPVGTVVMPPKDRPPTTRERAEAVRTLLRELGEVSSIAVRRLREHSSLTAASLEQAASDLWDAGLVRYRITEASGRARTLLELTPDGRAHLG